MQSSQEAQAESPNPLLTLGGRVSQGTTLTVLAAAGVGSGLVLGWDSLVALGVSGLILSLLPCLAICALGLCASRMGKKDTDAATAPIAPKEPPAP